MLALLGCSLDTAQQDRARYEAVLRAPTPAEPALESCRQIRDTALAGDCALVVVAAADTEPVALCGEVPAGMWPSVRTPHPL